MQRAEQRTSWESQSRERKMSTLLGFPVYGMLIHTLQLTLSPKLVITENNLIGSQGWWATPVIPTLGRPKAKGGGEEMEGRSLAGGVSWK